MIRTVGSLKEIFMTDTPQKQTAICPKPAYYIYSVSPLHFAHKRCEHNEGKKQEHQYQENKEAIYTEKACKKGSDHIHKQSQI